MKLKVYILKKKHIILTLSIAFILILSLILLISFKSKETIKNVNPVQTVHADVDGDKKLDTLYISTNKDNNYTVNVQTKKGDGFNLEPDPLLKTLGYNDKSWPMSIECKDINNDNAQEIIIQSSDKSESIIHVYTYSKQNKEFIRLISGKYNVFASAIHNGTPIIMLGKKLKTDIDFSYYTLNNDTLSTYNLDYISLGKNTLNSLASFISEDNIEVISSDSNLLTNLEKGELLDALLLNVKYKNNIPSECTYQIRTMPYGENSKINLYEVKMNSVSYKDNNIQYKIKNIKSLN
ncbi:hypothetical protein [Clostridium cylindrosporum]|uniref:Uncharacterized protein n=1 Tax=Clostridium cylindrosporum DSM 605 TaxID=1121307 RepID=A0A0J8DAS8_CLOCY|nr:hypothetical protein [Clostridium cylindrosporum]KMT23150.1 hypothetical protein CLCY_6c00310 [Clostridium cylindrosporum DSM 605]